MPRARHTGGVGSIRKAKPGASGSSGAPGAAAYDLPSLFPRINLGTISGLTASNMLGKYLRPDGKRLYVAYRVSGTVAALLEFALLKPNVIASAVYVGSVTLPDMNGRTATGYALEFSPDGTLILLGVGEGYLQRFSLSTPWDLATLAKVGSLASLPGFIPATNYRYTGLNFKPDGTKLWAAFGTSSAAGRFYNLATAWDIATATQGAVVNSQSLDGGSQTVVNILGSTILQYGSVGRIDLYALASAWPGGTGVNQTLSSQSGIPSLNDPANTFNWSADGKILFMGSGNGMMYQIGGQAS